MSDTTSRTYDEMGDVTQPGTIVTAGRVEADRASAAAEADRAAAVAEAERKDRTDAAVRQAQQAMNDRVETERKAQAARGAAAFRASGADLDPSAVNVGAPVPSPLDLGNLRQLEALRVDLVAATAAMKNILQRMHDLAHDAARK